MMLLTDDNVFNSTEKNTKRESSSRLCQEFNGWLDRAFPDGWIDR